MDTRTHTEQNNEAITSAKNFRLFEHYITGLKDFRRRFYSNTNSGRLFKKLVEEGQRPPTMLIACCDSRANPSDVLNLLPGDAFITRTIMNLIPKYDPDAKPSATAAALEYAVTILNVEHIILMGHTNCGGIQALLNPSFLQKNSFIRSWVSLADEPKETALKKSQHLHPKLQAKACEEEVLRFSLANLLTYPWIKEKVESGFLSLHGWIFDLTTGTISCLNQKSNQFEGLMSEEVNLVPTAKL